MKWNRKNSDYFRSNYLQKKLEAAGQCDTPATENRPRKVLESRIKTGLSIGYVKEVIGTQYLVIIEYQAQLIHRRFTERMIEHLIVNTPCPGKLPARVFQRGDPHLTPCNH